MPYSDIEGLPADYYPPRRARMVVGAIMAGWVFLMFSSSHQGFFDRLYRTGFQKMSSLVSAKQELPGDYPTSLESYRLQGSLIL